MRIDRLGEYAAILRDLDADPAEVAESLERSNLPGLIEAVASYETVGVYFEPGFDVGRLLARSERTEPVRHSKSHTIPICYEFGEDLEEVARTLQLTPEEVIGEHVGRDYYCYAIGFCPGFPYLGYLSEPLSGMPRRKEPRTRIEPGSVAITGRQCGIYPLARPGGWAILGRTPVVLVDVESRYFPIRAGDRVRFTAISRDEFAARRGERL